MYKQKNVIESQQKFRSEKHKQYISMPSVIYITAK